MWEYQGGRSIKNSVIFISSMNDHLRRYTTVSFGVKAEGFQRVASRFVLLWLGLRYLTLGLILVRRGLLTKNKMLFTDSWKHYLLIIFANFVMLRLCYN